MDPKSKLMALEQEVDAFDAKMSQRDSEVAQRVELALKTPTDHERELETRYEALEQERDHYKRLYEELDPEIDRVRTKLKDVAKKHGITLVLPLVLTAALLALLYSGARNDPVAERTNLLAGAGILGFHRGLTATT